MLDFDHVLERIGGLGRFQIVAFLLLCYYGIPAGLSALASVFISYTPSYRCNIAYFDDNNGSFGMTMDEILNITTPMEDGDFDGCRRYVGNYSACPGDFSCINKSLPAIACDSGYEYDRSLFSETSVTEFDLVCDQRILNALAGSMYMVGMLLGSFTFGNLSDLLGRKPATLIATVGMFACMCGLSFARSYVLFVVLRLLIAAFMIGAYIPMFTYVIEIVGVKYRTLIGVGFQIAFALGYMIWSGIAYQWRDWHQGQLVSFLISIPCIIPVIFLPESARWLINKGRVEKGKDVIKTMAKYNGVPVDDELWDSAKKAAEAKLSEGESHDTRKYSSIDLFRTKRMRIMTLLLMFNWAVCSMVYYGISLNAGSLAGDIFLNNIYAGVLEIGSYIACILTLDVFGRKKLLCFTLGVTGIALLISTAVNEYTEQNSALVMVGVAFAFVGKAMISGSFAIIYNYTSELYPTQVRTNAMGIGSTGARVGSILAPFILDLSNYVSWLPNTILGVVSIIAAALVIFFPETNGRKMLESIEEAEEFYAGKATKDIDNTYESYENKMYVDDEEGSTTKL